MRNALLLLVALTALASAECTLFAHCPASASGAFEARAIVVVDGQYSCGEVAAGVVMPNGTSLPLAVVCEGNVNKVNYAPPATGVYKVVFVSCGSVANCDVSAVRAPRPAPLPDLPAVLAAAVAIACAFFAKN